MVTVESPESHFLLSAGRHERATHSEDLSLQVYRHRRAVVLASEGHYRRRHLIVLRTVHTKREIQCLIRVGSQVDHSQIIGKEVKTSRSYFTLPLLKEAVANRVIKIQFTPISGDRIGAALIIVIQNKVTQ